MAQAVWTGSLGFGLVNIPVALYPATESKDVRFRLFDPKTGKRVRYRRVTDLPASEETREDERRSSMATAALDEASAPEPMTRAGGRPEEAVVESDYRSLLRGYEVERDRFVMVEPQELERLRPERSRTIEIEDFVRLEDIDPVFFEKSYHVAPRRGADVEKPYALLLRAMERTGRVGIGRFVLRTKPHLVAIRATPDGLILETLYFSDEVRSQADVVRDLSRDVSARELRLAETLIETLATDWEPGRYGDPYRQELLELLSAKEPTGSILEEPDAADAGAGGDVERLMEALKLSVEAAKAREGKDKRRAG